MIYKTTTKKTNFDDHPQSTYILLLLYSKVKYEIIQKKK